MILKFFVFALIIQCTYAQDISSSSQEKKHDQEIEHKTDENINQPAETKTPQEAFIHQQLNDQRNDEEAMQQHPPPEDNTHKRDLNEEHYQFEIDTVKSKSNEDEILLNKYTNEQEPPKIINNFENINHIPPEKPEDISSTVIKESLNNEGYINTFQPEDIPSEIREEVSKETINNGNLDTSMPIIPDVTHNDILDQYKELEAENLEDNKETNSQSGTSPVRLKIMSGNQELGDLFVNEEELMTDTSDDDVMDDVPSENSDKVEIDPQTKLAKELYEKARGILRKRSTSSSAPAYSTAYELIAQAAKLNYGPALEDVAYAYLFGRHFRQNVTKAMVMFEDLASHGSPSAQMGLGFIYAIGLGVPSSQAKAIIYYNFAALGGNPFAQMALGYRHKYGYSLEQSCESSLTYYRRVARIVAQEVRQSGSSDGPGVIQRIRLLDLVEPPQTPPATPSSGGENSESTSSSSASVVLDKDLLKYYKYLADKGDVQAQVGLGQLLYQGGRGVAPDPVEAARLFTAAARDSGNAYAQAYLGKMYLEGNEALRQNNETALDYFLKSADQNNPMGQTGLGLIYLYGHGVPADAQKAFAYFKIAADQGGPEAQLNIANMYFTGTGVAANYKHALKYYTLASQSGNLLAFFNLGQMHAVGLGAMRSCYTAMELFKNVAERGFWGRMLMEAYEAYKGEDVASALAIYAFLAELGYETGQSNAAYILEKESVNWFPYNESLSRAFLLWKRAAIQGYPMARIKLGDFHYYGYGTPVDFEAAAQNYRLAYEAQNSARAVFNLAFMHEKGFGLKKDLHLARRYYDMALEASPDAYIPVTLALTKLALLLYYEQIVKLNLKDVLAKIYDIDHYLPQDWDLYAILAFAFILGTLIYFRRTQRV